MPGCTLSPPGLTHQSPTNIYKGPRPHYVPHEWATPAVDENLLPASQVFQTLYCVALLKPTLSAPRALPGRQSDPYSIDSELRCRDVKVLAKGAELGDQSRGTRPLGQEQRPACQEPWSRAARIIKHAGTGATGQPRS